MAHASADTVIRQDADRRQQSRVCFENLQAYARNRLDAAIAYPKERLLRRDFRMARLDMTIWFSSEELADLCARTLMRRKHDDPSAARIEVYAIDAGSGDGNRRRYGAKMGDLHRAISTGFSTRSICAVFIMLRRPGSSMIGPPPMAWRRFLARWTSRHGNPARHSACSCIGHMRLPKCALPMRPRSGLPDMVP